MKSRSPDGTLALEMIAEKRNRASVPPTSPIDPYEDRRATLHKLPALERITAIESDLEKVKRLATTAGTFHRKKLLRMHDAARLEAGLVTPEQLQRENSFTTLDFSTARLVFQPRPRLRG